MNATTERPMAKKKGPKKSTGSHDPNTLSLRLEATYRERLERVTAVTHRPIVTEVRLALDKYLTDIEARIEAGAFGTGG